MNNIHIFSDNMSHLRAFLLEECSISLGIYTFLIDVRMQIEKVCLIWRSWENLHLPVRAPWRCDSSRRDTRRGEINEKLAIAVCFHIIELESIMHFLLPLVSLMPLVVLFLLVPFFCLVKALKELERLKGLNGLKELKKLKGLKELKELKGLKN